ncbi:MAG TPA: tetratricopeptide repeat protein [Oscillatoriaceae cyanobacterium M33_DOE_052]|uniref:Tetratricopeptide repeat protein n=1 Tax=Planktothricoides sp. SpSt-374 TaxID=2282167 RepID=A0A7C3VJL7_9CYAN|nr:tetratricopeptide repeat protein [Oscillatoriaceae cyanobacterium M33_DOE_052]
MDNSFVLTYISVLLGLLSIAAWFVFRQVIKTRRVESRLSQLQSKLKEKPGTAIEYYELGSIYLDKKLFAQAVELFKKALKAKDLEGEENMALIYNALGFAYSALEQYDLAIRQYKEALKIQPEYVTALNNIGYAYERKNLASQALESYEEALKYDPKNATAKSRAESMRRRMVGTA